MAETSGFRTRSPLKQNHIVTCLRDEIVQGKFQPGERLPTRSVLEGRFEVSSVTLQRSLDRLMKEGFVYAQGSMGTFVSDHPPHLAHIGVVLPMTPTDDGYNRFHAAMTSEAMKFEQRTGRKVTIYYGGGGHADSEDFRRLLRHVQQHRAAGLIFAHPVKCYTGTPLLDEAGIPRIAIADAPVPTPGLSFVTLDRMTLIRKGLDFLASKGRRKLAVITNDTDIANKTIIENLMAEAAQRGISTGLHWMQGANIEASAAAANLARLLMFSGQSERPDALMILDDNLVEHATAGVVASNVKVPEQLDVVAHCNFPWPTPSAIPITRIGFNNTEVLTRCVELIDALRTGAPVPTITQISAVRQDEISA